MKAIKSSFVAYAVFMAVSAFASATPDAQGRTPNVWLPLDGSMDSQGTITLSWKDTSSSYIATSKGQALCYEKAPWTSGADVSAILGSQGFTVMTSARLGTAAKSTLFCIGSVNSGNKHILILAQGATPGQVELVDAYEQSTSGGSGTITSVVAATVDDCARVFHHYAVSVAPDEEGYAVTLYVDGENVATGTLGTIPTGGGVQFFSVFDGRVDGYTVGSGAAMDDFRIYSDVLDAETVATYASEFPVFIVPAYWYKFDGNLDASGSSSWTVGGDSDVTYKTEDNGIQALDNSGKHPWGSGISFGDSGWTVVLRAMGEETDNAVIMGLGSRRSDNNNAFAFAMGGKSRFSVATWTYPGNETDVADHEHLFNVTVFNAYRQYHDYALVYEPPAEEDVTGTLTLYVDGKNRGSVDRTLNMDAPDTKSTYGAWQIGDVHSGSAKVSLKTSTASRVDDFRLYQAALTTEQIGRIAAENPVWPYYSSPMLIMLR